MSTTYELKHQAIVKAAIAVFLQNGYARTSMDKVAQVAGISKVTLYNHFKDKKQLFENVMTMHCQTFTDRKKSIEFDPDVSSKEALTAFGHRMVTILLDKKSLDLMRLVIAESGQNSDLAETIWPQGKMPLLEEFREYAQAACAAKRLKIKNVERAARQFAGLIKENLVWPRLMGVPTSKDSADRDGVIADAVAMFLARYEVQNQSK